MKKGNCPSGVSGAPASHSTRTGHRAGKTIEAHAPRRACVFNRRLLTRWVKGWSREIVEHTPDNAVILVKLKAANCRI
jgi:hypothetical protein